MGLTVLAVVAMAGDGGGRADGELVGGLSAAFLTALAVTVLAGIAATTLVRPHGRRLPALTGRRLEPRCAGAEC